MSGHGARIRCRDYVLAALRKQMERRDDRDWVEQERVAVAVAANNWALSNGYSAGVTRWDVERLEAGALGHVDYASKLALYVAEFVCESFPRAAGAASVARNDTA